MVLYPTCDLSHLEFHFAVYGAIYIVATVTCGSTMMVDVAAVHLDLSRLGHCKFYFLFLFLFEYVQEKYTGLGISFALF
jgi:hypothetical protein